MSLPKTPPAFPPLQGKRSSSLRWSLPRSSSSARVDDLGARRGGAGFLERLALHAHANGGSPRSHRRSRSHRSSGTEHLFANYLRNRDTTVEDVVCSCRDPFLAHCDIHPPSQSPPPVHAHGHEHDAREGEDDAREEVDTADEARDAREEEEEEEEEEEKDVKDEDADEDEPQPGPEYAAAASLAMQSGTSPHRSLQRRSPVDLEKAPAVPVHHNMSSNTVQPRESSSSMRSNQSTTSSRRQVPPPSVASTSTRDATLPLSQIEKSVTHLLVATKQLLETLTQWSRGVATDTMVSDVYVRLGYEFNIASRAFVAIGVDTSDLGNVPELLRDILELTLSQEASVESLEKYLPRIRDIIINLLHGLKRKQQKLRQRTPRETAEAVSRNTSITSTSTTGTTGTGLTTMLDQGLNGGFVGSSAHSERCASSDVDAPARGSSTGHRPGAQDMTRGSVASSSTSLSSNTMQNMPVVPPYTGEDASTHQEPTSPVMDSPFNGPAVPPKQSQALATLQGKGDLERRASRRYSQYQISKLMGGSGSPIAVPVLPPAQNSPIPNRGRSDMRESVRAVQSRSDRQTRAPPSKLGNEVSPHRLPSRIAEEPTPDHASDFGDATRSQLLEIGQQNLRRQDPIDQSTTTTTAMAIPKVAEMLGDAATIKQAQPSSVKSSHRARSPATRPYTPPTEESRASPHKLTLFLQYRTKVKKFVLDTSTSEVSMAKLQLAFIEKFSWNTHNNGVDLPEIYIQDPVSGVRHELEDVADVKDRTVLVLNVDGVDEVKRHIDVGIKNLTDMVNGVRTSINDQQTIIQRVSDRQQEAATEIARLSSNSARVSMMDNSRVNGMPPKSRLASQAQLTEVQSIRRDLAVVRQTFSSFQTDVQSSMATIRKKAQAVKTVSIKASIPDVEDDGGRAYVNTSKKQIQAKSDQFVARLDDLQDLVEDLRKDVVTRGVRPLPRQLESVAKDIQQASQEVNRMYDHIKKERPIWTKIWEKELETVCTDREELALQEELITDLQNDLKDTMHTFGLVEQTTKEQAKDNNGVRVPSRGLITIPAADPTVAKEGVLGEVRALQPNHQNRLEAIERAERMRQIELESRRGGELQKELTNFVEGDKLKKSGGYEEVDRARKAKDDRIRKEVWERMNGMTMADATAGSQADTPNTATPAEAAVELDSNGVPQL